MWPNQATGGCKSYGKPPENLSFLGLSLIKNLAPKYEDYATQP
jgi:hypothetical protein